MRRPLALALLLALLAPAAALAEAVVPSERVRSRVVVRAEARPGGVEVGSLRPGQRAERLDSRDGWHRVRLSDATEGFVSAAWTRVLPAEAPAAPATGGAEVAGPDAAGLGDSLRRWLGAASARLRGTPRVEFSLHDPARDGGVHRHDQAKLPVAGFASAAGSNGLYDVVLVLDASTSTNEFAEGDVNGDGRLEDEWKGGDSIYQAQIRAARELVAELRRLPGNRGGERIRVGVVTFAGDEQHDGDAGFEPAPETIRALAARDARLRIGLSGDYAALDRGLAQLAREVPSGMTDFAAGVGRALLALGALPSGGVAARGPRPEAEKVIFFLTDGKPRLPGDPETATRAALYAARLAREGGVRIHTFALGRDAVTRSMNPALERMARRSGGRAVELREPGRIVETLRSTSFAFVQEVRLVNRTLGRASDGIATGIDGSFFGEIPLAEGANEIEVVAVLSDARSATRTLVVTYEDAKPIRELERQLASLREENEALIERIRTDLVREMQTTRREARKSISLAAERAQD